MKKFLLIVAVLSVLTATVGGLLYLTGNPTIATKDVPPEAGEPDLPAFIKRAKKRVSKEEFLTERAAGIALKRGIAKDQPFDPEFRMRAIAKMEKQEELNAQMPDSQLRNALQASWSPIGPAPIPNGQTSPSAPVSGRVTAIAVHPTNPNIVYVGAAQGGVYRSTDGGTNWTPITDSAQSLAIGSLALAPTQPETLYVGTGEGNFSTDSFFGVGLYRIDNASTTATLNGPFNLDAVSNDIFSGRSISKIIVHPNDPATIFLSTTTGRGGIRPAFNQFPNRGIYRSTNATSAAPGFTQIGVLPSPNDNFSVRDIAIDPTDPNIMVASMVVGGGGLYRTTDALAPSPTFTQVLNFTCTTTSNCTAELVAQRSGGAANATFYVATGDGNGRVLQSTDGGVNWTEQIDNDFCGGQCFYDIAIAVDPTNPANLYLGGDPTIIAARSTDSGLTFIDSRARVHVDTHALTVAPSNPSIVYLGTDGGIYKSTDAGVNWTPLNNSQFSATQFMSIDVHPSDPNFTIGGTQDNGTNMYRPDGTWNRVDFGDGGYAQIDQNAADTTSVRMYHTYFSNSGLQGYATVANVGSAQSGFWTFRGCQNNGQTTNGITCNGSVNFYAPLERGPGNPNTIYYGSDRLYRSDDTGLTHTVVSQNPIEPGTPISSIGISPQNDNVRVVGLNGGGLYGTSTGSNTLDDLDPGNAIPNVTIGRTVIDPNSQTTAYVTLSAFNVPNVYKTTNLNNLAAGLAPTWTDASGTGGTALPQVPVNALVVDPQNSSTIYVGTDIGVFVSTNGGGSWAPFGTGLPRVAVFGIAITNSNPRKLRIATHGRGMYEISLAVGQPVRFDYDGDRKTDISIFRPGPGQWWIQNSSNLVTTANTFGISTDTIVPADYTGDGKVDIAFYRNGQWFVLRSEDSSFFAFGFGAAGDIPSPGDFDGDGTADPAVFRPGIGTWFILKSGGGTTIRQFGLNGDRPVPADFDGDGRDDLAIYRPNVSEWFYERSSDSQILGFQFGTNGDRALPADFTGDGRADIAYWRPSNGFWVILRSEDFSFFAFPFGGPTDIPVPGDYDGDGRTDAAVFRPASVTWFINGTTSGQIIQAFGAPGDVPTPSSYVR